MLYKTFCNEGEILGVQLVSNRNVHFTYGMCILVLLRFKIGSF